LKIRHICLSLISLLWTINSLHAAPIVQTTTSLAITSTNGAVTTVTSGSAVTLTATVNYGPKAVTVGQVNFCDATAASCTDIHLLGTAQLTSAGTASIKLTPSIGSHSYKAIFVGTPHGATSLAGSASAVLALSVTGLWPSVTTVATSGSAGNYTLTATTGGAGDTAPTGF
jgi:trimeric autotransporter adhesin